MFIQNLFDLEQQPLWSNRFLPRCIVLFYFVGTHQEPIYVIIMFF